MKTLKKSKVKNLRNEFLILKTNELLQIRGGEEESGGGGAPANKEGEID
jgi:hypothetical protein